MKSILEKCPCIIDVKELNLNHHIHKKLSEQWKEILKERLEKVNAYKIVYKVRELNIVGFVMIPKYGKDLPCILHLRGGSGDFGKITEERLVNQQTVFTDNGYVVISTQYPGVDGGTGTDSFGGKDDIDSIKKLKDILECIPQADTNRIGVRGHSRGGTMTYMLLREVTWVKAAVIGGAPTDEFKAGKEREGWKEHQIRMYGESEDELYKRSAIKWVNKLPKDVPILLVHGSADKRVFAIHSIDMSSAFYKNKIPHRFILFEGADHSITEFKREYTEQTIKWFDTYLAKDRKLPDIQLHGN